MHSRYPHSTNRIIRHHRNFTCAPRPVPGEETDPVSGDWLNHLPFLTYSHFCHRILDWDHRRCRSCHSSLQGRNYRQCRSDSTPAHRREPWFSPLCPCNRLPTRGGRVGRVWASDVSCWVWCLSEWREWGMQWPMDSDDLLDTIRCSIPGPKRKPIDKHDLQEFVCRSNLV